MQKRQLCLFQGLARVHRENLITEIEVFHSEIPDKKQNEIASSLMSQHGMIKVVIATSALSMGFDAVGKISSNLFLYVLLL